jgi:flagellar protein FliL
MKRFILPLLIALAGLGGGAAFGLMQGGASEGGEAHGATAEAAPEHGAAADEAPHGEAAQAGSHDAPAAGGHGEASSGTEFVKIPQQFVVPVIKGDKVASLIVISLSLEVTPGSSETVFNREPKLRDSFLQVMFLHAHSGGFDGAFTTGRAMEDFRAALMESAQVVLGAAVVAVLVTDIVRQDA